MAQTENLKLPLIDGTMTADVPRDVNALANAVDASVTKAVKVVSDRAEQAFQAGNDRKAEVVAALVAKGISASTSETWASLISKMSAIIKATGTASVVEVLAGKTFSNVSGNGLVGTMPNKGAVTITPTIADQQIPAGYHDGNGKVVAVDVPSSKILADTTIAGRKGIIPIYGKSAGGNSADYYIYAKAVKPSPYVAKQVLYVTPQTGYYTDTEDTDGRGVIRIDDPNFHNANIVEGLSMFGLVGTGARRFAKGTISSSTTKDLGYKRATDLTGGMVGEGTSEVLVSGIGNFVPKFIIIYPTGVTNNVPKQFTVYVANAAIAGLVGADIFTFGYTATGGTSDCKIYYNPGGNAVVDKTGFRLPYNMPSTFVGWIAVG